MIQAMTADSSIKMKMTMAAVRVIAQKVVSMSVMYSALAIVRFQAQNPDIGHLVQRRLVDTSPWKDIANGAFTLAFRNIEHYRKERKPGCILDAADILAEKRWISAVHDADSGLGIKDEDVIRETFPADCAGRCKQTSLRVVGAYFTGVGLTLEGVRHLPDRVDDRTCLFGALRDEFGAAISSAVTAIRPMKAAPAIAIAANLAAIEQCKKRFSSLRMVICLSPGVASIGHRSC